MLMLKMTVLKSSFWKASIALFVVIVFLPILPTHAQFGNQAQLVAKKCDCFCATKEGTKPPGGGEIKVLSVSDCKDSCKAQKDKMAVCAFDLTQYPAQNQNCFTQEQCTAAIKEYCGDPSQKDPNSSVVCGSTEDTFDSYQPPECMPGSHYCYAPKNSTNVRLNISIGGLIMVNDLETYIGTIFKWMETAGIIIAIVLIMIGGLQYALGGFSSGQLDSGKKRIKNAALGLILLMCSIVIIELINPQLSSVSVPRLPMIKTVNIAGAGKSCETLHDTEKFKIGIGTNAKEDYGESSPGCGKIGVLLEGPKKTAVAAGSTCNFKYCPYENNLGYAKDQCLGGGKNAKCLPCGEIYEGSDVIKAVGVSPSPSVCGGFVFESEGPVEKPTKIQRCGWTKDAEVNKGALAGAVKVFEAGACVFVDINCSEIENCEDYGIKVKASNEFKKNVPLVFLNSDPSNISLQSICEENPCKIKLEQRGCNFYEDREPSLPLSIDNLGDYAKACANATKEEGIADKVGDALLNSIVNPLIDAVGL